MSNKIKTWELCCASSVVFPGSVRWMLVDERWFELKTELFLYDWYTENYNHYLIAHTVTEHVKSCVSHIIRPFFWAGICGVSVFSIRHNLLLPYEVASCGRKNPYEDFMYWLLYFLSTASYD